LTALGTKAVGGRIQTRRHRVWPFVVIGGPVVLIGVAALVVWLTLPPLQAELRVPGLSAPVDVTLDQWGIPRIKAANEVDAAAALGYLHARDRMFEMDLMRRAASGRLSEIAGPRALRLDRMARILGEQRHAAETYQALPDHLKSVLAAYTAGVNAWITARGRLAAPEFLALGAPEPWTPVDCLLWSETVSLWLSDNYRTELDRAALAGRLPMERILELWPPQPDTAAPDSSVPPPVPVRQGLLDALPAFPGAFTLPSEASNAWAVDGHHTPTGSPLLAGDPHLSLSFPSIWYLARIETPGAVLVGATAPGVPFLVIGHNAHIAWSFTTTGIDTQDVFTETVLPDGRYVTPEGPAAFVTRQERIRVRGAPDDLLTVRATRHGPVISDAFVPGPGRAAGPVMAVAMAQFRLGSPAPGLFALNHAASVADAGRAAGLMTAPMQNLTVADHDGIALFTTGAVPIRRSGDGSLPVSGADGLHDWTGFASGDQLPHVVAPASGTVENANERTAPPSFPVFLGRDFPAPIRARRIHQLLSARSGFAPADFQAMQDDDLSVFAQDVLPILRALPRQPGLTGQAQALLDRWDGTMAVDRPQPLIFNAALQGFVARTLAANHVPESQSGPWADFAEFLLSPAGGVWCGGDCRPALGTALQAATQDLATRFGNDPAAWRWGNVHKAVFAHPILGDLPVIGAWASARIAVPGDDTTLFRGGNGRLGDFASLHGAAYRGIYDLADLERSRFVVTPGQSGNIFSAHAWDMMPLWAAGTTIAIKASPDQVSARIRLTP
jgi:penicillin amidase